MTTIDERLSDLYDMAKSVEFDGWERAAKKLFLDLIAEAKPEKRVATSWQQGIEVKAFEDAIRVYEYKLKQAINGGKK